MFLGPVSYIDCFIFLIFLAPQLIIQAGFWTTLYHGIRSLPFLGLPNIKIIEIHLTDLSNSAGAASSDCSPAVSDTQDPESAFLPPRDIISGDRDPMRQICLRGDSSQGGTHLHGQGGCSSFSSLSNVEAWLSSIPVPLSGGSTRKST